jgi:hypothetical protein
MVGAQAPVPEVLSAAKAGAVKTAAAPKRMPAVVAIKRRVRVRFCEAVSTVNKANLQNKSQGGEFSTHYDALSLSVANLEPFAQDLNGGALVRIGLLEDVAQPDVQVRGPLIGAFHGELGLTETTGRGALFERFDEEASGAQRSPVRMDYELPDDRGILESNQVNRPDSNYFRPHHRPRYFRPRYWIAVRDG